MTSGGKNNNRFA